MQSKNLSDEADMNFIGTVLQDHMPIVWVILIVSALTAVALLNNVLSIAEKLPKLISRKVPKDAIMHCDELCPCKAELRQAKENAEREADIVNARAEGLAAQLASLEGSLRKLQVEAKGRVSGKIGITAEELAELARNDKGGRA